MQRRARAAARAGAALLFVFSSVSSVPTADAMDSLDESQSSARRTYALPPPPPAITEDERLPLLDLRDVEGLLPKDVVEVVPGVTDATSPDDALAGTTALPKQSDSDFDAYGFGPEKTNHVAVVFPGDVNVLRANGAWRDVPTDLTQTATGWTWTDSGGFTTTLPAALSADAPVQIASAEGLFTLSPAEGASKGSPTETGVTYGAALGDADLRYTPIAGALQEEIVLTSRPTSGAFAFTATAKNLSLTPNEYGGIDVVSLTGPIATLPAPVAYDANPDPASSVGTYELSETSPGTYSLVVAIDPAYLATAAYPVVIDPTWSHATSRDGYTSSASPNTSFETSTRLQVDQGKRSYLDFDAPDLHVDERLSTTRSSSCSPPPPGAFREASTRSG